MRRLTLTLMLLTALTPDASAFGRRCRCKARPATATACQPAPAARPTHLPATMPSFAPPVLTGPVATAVRQCGGSSCPK